MINYSFQYIDNQDVKSVIKTLKSKWLTTGPAVEKFEAKIKKKEFKTLHSCKFSYKCFAPCMQVFRCTKGDYVWTSSNTFVASQIALYYVVLK